VARSNRSTAASCAATKAALSFSVRHLLLSSEHFTPSKNSNASHKAISPRRRALSVLPDDQLIQMEKSYFFGAFSGIAVSLGLSLIGAIYFQKEVLTYVRPDH
jgi:hypothetical protein